MFSGLIKRYRDLDDLERLRRWLLDLLTAVFVFLFPVSVMAFLPTYIAREYYSIIVLDVIFWMLLLIRSFFPRIGHRIGILFWITAIYCMAISFFIVLGPDYARPVWMLSCVVMVSILMGVRQAVISVAVNAVLLITGYVFLVPGNPAWARVAHDGLHNWIMFTLNSSLLSLLVALPVGLIITRLNVSLEKERKGKQEVQAAMEELEATNEEFEAQNEELIRSEEEISRKESFIRRIMENAPAAVFRLSLDSLRVEYANARTRHITGYPFNEAESARELMRELVPADWRPRVGKFWAEFLDSRGAPFIRFPVIHKSGQRKWVDLRVVLVLNGDEKPAAVEGFAIDVTDQVEAGEALKESEEQYRNLVENISEAVFSIDSQGCITYMSPSIRRFGEFDPDRVIGRNFLEFIHPDDRTEIVNSFKDLSNGIENPLDYRIVSASGAFRWVQSSSRSRIENGIFVGASGIITDIHERRIAEDTLRESRATLESFVNALPDPGFLIDDERRILVVNTALCLMLGRDKNEVVGRRVFDLFPPNVMNRSFYHFDRCFADGQSAVFEENHNGRDYIVYIHPALNEAGKVSRIAAIALDITARKSAEAERERTHQHLIQAQKMEAVGTLAGGIAHDFNNMLGAIMGSINMMELLLLEEGEIQKEAVLKYIETAMESSRRAAEMIRQLLTLSRKSELKLAPVDVNLSVKHVISLCRNSLPKSVEIDFSVCGDPVRVLADPVQIEQVILNLCVNASHAMTIMRGDGERHGGALRVAADEVVFDGNSAAGNTGLTAGETYARITVSDTGIGMSDEIMRNIFDPFFTTKETGDGTGLGLAIAYGIVRQHRGFIDVSSEPGRGSTFSVYLPVYCGDTEGNVRPSAREGIVPGEGKILVIDDEGPLLKISRGMLELCGYSVVTADNGKDGVAILAAEKENIAGVLLDLSLVGMSGIEVFRSMMEIHPGVKVVLTSGLVDDDILQKAMDMGIRGFVQKPYSARELSVKIREALGQ